MTTESQYRELLEQALEVIVANTVGAEDIEDALRAVIMDQTAHDMNTVAEEYAHKLALDLECVLADYSGKWWDTAMQTLGDYRSAMNAIHERESPTLMGEPVIRKDKP